MRMSWERWAGLAGVAYVVLFIGAFALGIEVGPSDREILEHYADSGSRSKETIAFFLIAAACLAFLVFAAALRNLIAWADREPSALAALAWAGGIACAVLMLAGNAVSFAAMLLVGAVSVAALRHGVLPRWLGWAGFPVALLLPTAVGFLGFLVLMVWALAVSAAVLIACPTRWQRTVPSDA